MKMNSFLCRWTKNEKRMCKTQPGHEVIKLFFLLNSTATVYEIPTAYKN